MLALSVPSIALAASPIACLECAHKEIAERRGNVDVQVVATQRTPDSVVRRPDGRHETVGDTASRHTRRSSCPGCTYSTIRLSEAQGVDRIPAARYPTCPPGRDGRPGETLFLYRSDPGTAGRQFVAPVCSAARRAAAPDDAEPVITLAMIEGELRRRVQEVAPASTELGFAPAGSAIVNLPVLVWATPQQAIQRDFAPFGIPVGVTLVPTWEWTFEPGATARTSSPGQPYRDNGVPVAADPGYVTHTYRSPGARTVTVTVRWSATWSLDGGPPRPLGDLTRADTAALTVREAPSRLVAR